MALVRTIARVAGLFVVLVGAAVVAGRLRTYPAIEFFEDVGRQRHYYLVDLYLGRAYLSAYGYARYPASGEKHRELKSVDGLTTTRQVCEFGENNFIEGCDLFVNSGRGERLVASGVTTADIHLSPSGDKLYFVGVYSEWGASLLQVYDTRSATFSRLNHNFGGGFVGCVGDGSWCVLQRRVRGGSGLYKLNMETSHVEQIYTDKHLDYRLLTETNHIIYLDSARDEIILYDPATNRNWVLFKPANGQISEFQVYEPDGLLVATVTHLNKRQAYITDLIAFTPNRRGRLISGDLKVVEPVRWSNEQEKLLFSAFEDSYLNLFVVDPKTYERVRLTEFDNASEIHAWFASNPQQVIALMRNGYPDPTDQVHMYHMPTDGSHPPRVVNLPFDMPNYPPRHTADAYHSLYAGDFGSSLRQ